MQKFLDNIGNILAKFLPESIMKILNPFLTVSFVTFVVIGVLNTVNMLIFASGSDYLISHANFSDVVMAVLVKSRVSFLIGYVLSLTISFFLHTHFTFHEKPTLKKALKFPLSYVPNFLIQYVLVFILTAFNIHRTLSYMIASGIAIPVTYLTMKFFVYRKK